MISSRTLGVAVVALILSMPALGGQPRGHYRDFQLGGSLASVAALSGAAASDTKTIHQRPALMQDLEWRPASYLVRSTTLQNDPVERIVFSFYDDQLFRVLVDYDRQRTQGLTDADIVEALSAVYGSAAKPALKKSGVSISLLETESGMPLARWEDAESSIVLYRSSYGSGFRLIVTSLRLNALARTAAARALRLDEREAPQREIARQKKEADDARALQEKARLANKAAFRP